MTLEDFNCVSDNTYLSKERFWFENDKVAFWYRIRFSTFTSDDERLANVKNTSYDVIMVVDDESIHENHKDMRLKHHSCGFWLKRVEKRGEPTNEMIEKVLNSALKLKIENIIKKNKYQKIKGIINGTTYTVW